jgi:hypothetical protein
MFFWLAFNQPAKVPNKKNAPWLDSEQGSHQALNRVLYSLVLYGYSERSGRMRITLHNKCIQVCSLLCSLLFLECFSFGIFSLAPAGSAGINKSTAGWSSEASSAMSDGANLGALGACDGTRINLVPVGNTRGLGFNPHYSSAALLSALLLAGLISYLRLSQKISIQFDSLQITTFLHKKDGKK